MEAKQDSAVPKPKTSPNVRKVNGFLIYMDEFLGEGQYGKVVKAQKIEDQKVKGQKQVGYKATPDTSKLIYACKIIDVANISQEDMESIQKEVRIHALVDSKHAIKLYQTIKTTSNIYMLMDYCNGFDLSVLLK